MSRSTLLSFLLILSATLAHAQKYEVDPYAGGFFPGKFLNVIDVKNEGLYGLRAGVFLSRRIEAGVNAGYVNDLRFVDTLTRKKAYIWEGDVSYHWRVSPMIYGSFGIGGMTTTV